MGILLKIATFFSKKVHLSKLKLLIILPVIISILMSAEIKLNFKNWEFEYLRDSNSVFEMIALFVFLFSMIAYDTFHNWIESQIELKQERQLNIYPQGLTSGESTTDHMSVKKIES